MTPMMFLMHLREKYPQFAQQTNTGMYMQQDAEECWTQLLYSLRERLKVRSVPCSSTRSLTLALFPDPQRSCLSETRLGESCLSQTAPMKKCIACRICQALDFQLEGQASNSKHAWSPLRN